MKHWWRNVVSDYFTFTARERNGVVVMLVLILTTFFGFRMVPARQSNLDPTSFQHELAQLKISIDTATKPAYHRYYSNSKDEENTDYNRPLAAENRELFPKAETFEFDPNTATPEQWKRLGLRDKTIETIQKFLAKGFHFRQADDLKRVYGLRAEDAARLIPFVRIAGIATTGFAERSTERPVAPPAPVSNRSRIIDINTADTSAFIALPGIGAKLAARIVNFRQKLGGFATVNQLGETYGVPDSTFQRVKPLLQCNNPSLKKININTAGVDELRTHPYLRWNIANAIVNYRTQHGNFKSLDELKQIAIINDELFDKVAPYLAL